MSLDFKGSDGNRIAVGAKGIYSIQTVTGRYVLQGVGHDDLPMLTLPALGMDFGSFNGAAAYADRIDETRHNAGEISGL